MLTFVHLLGVFLLVLFKVIVVIRKLWLVGKIEGDWFAMPDYLWHSTLVEERGDCT
jgi:hypothetical protein